MSSEVFFYEDVDGMEDNVPSRESSAERDAEVSPERVPFLKLSESVPSFATHLAVDKAPGKKKGFRKFLMRSSKKKSSLPTVTSQPGACIQLYANVLVAAIKFYRETFYCSMNNVLYEDVIT